MNILYKDNVSEEITEKEEFMKLIERVNEDPSVLESLSLAELVQVNSYILKQYEMKKELLAELEAESKEDQIHVLLIEPRKSPNEVEIGRDFISLQEAVGGDFECIAPFDDDVVIICNETGKLNGLPQNRALRNKRGDICDILCGSFLVAGLGDDDFESLSPELMKKYEALFHQPETFVEGETA